MVGYVLKTGEETPQLEAHNETTDCGCRAAESRYLRPAFCQQSQRSPDHHDIGFHIMQPVVSCFTEFMHFAMQSRHLLRETLLSRQRRVNTLAVAVNARVQTLHCRHHISEGGAAIAVGGLLSCLAWDHDIIII